MPPLLLSHRRRASRRVFARYARRDALHDAFRGFLPGDIRAQA